MSSINIDIRLIILNVLVILHVKYQTLFIFDNNKKMGQKSAIHLLLKYLQLISASFNHMNWGQYLLSVKVM